MVRNPIEVMNSWVNAPKEFDSTWVVYEQIINAAAKNLGKIENFYDLESWIRTTKQFKALSQTFAYRVMLIKYSNLKSNLINTVLKIFEFVGLDFAVSTAEFLKNSANIKFNGTYSVFCGVESSNITLETNLIKIITQKVKNNGLANYIN